MNTKIKLEFDLSERLCDDEIIGLLQFENNKYKFSTHKNYKNKIIRSKEEYQRDYTSDYSKYKSLVVILESPHLDEFDVIDKNKKIIGNRPANGKTGERFRKEFEQIINNKYSSKLSKGNYFVYLVNSVQYQCSLGAKTNIFRDYVWLTLWLEREIRENFIDRLKIINPSIIINCCTNGGHTRDVCNGFMGLKNSKSNKGISKNYLQTLEYNLSKNIVKDKNDIEVLKYKVADEIKLKNFVRYQIKEVFNFKGIYEELNHPVNWY